MLPSVMRRVEVYEALATLLRRVWPCFALEVRDLDETFSSGKENSVRKGAMMEHQPKVFSSKSLESLGTVAFTLQILQDGTG